MSFKSDIQGTENLEHAWQKGIQALEPTDRAKLQIARTRDLCGGAAIDATLKSKYPSENRWDYVVGMRDGKDEVAHFIEVHPARNSSHIREVEAKAD